MAVAAVAQSDAICTAIASTQTCSQATSTSLRELLEGKDARSVESNKTTSSRPRAISQAAHNTSKKAINTANGGLSTKEKAVLATKVINNALKALGEAVKSPPVPASANSTMATKPPSNATNRKRKALRRSSSVPLISLHGQNLNRTSTPPPSARKTCQAPPVTAVSAGCIAVAECARIAFSILRALTTSDKIVLPELQLETGMSTFINKLIALNMFDLSLRELRLLKRRLECLVTKKKHAKVPVLDPTLTEKSVADLLEYPSINTPGPTTDLIIATQFQTLRIVHGLKRTALLNAALPFIRPSRSASLFELLLLLSKDAKANRSKCAKHFDTLAQTLLYLTPSVSCKDDDVARDSQVNPSPETAIEAQLIGLEARLQSWSLSTHTPDVDKDIVFPCSRCLEAFKRRGASDAKSKHKTLSNSFARIWKKIEASQLQPTMDSKSPLAAIYQLLGTSSREAGDFKDTTRWIGKLKGLVNPTTDSAARRCSVTAQLVASSLKQSPKVDEALIDEVLDGLKGSLAGNTTELEDLLASICLVSKASISIVTDTEGSQQAPQTTSDLLESFIFQLPRFALRWLGKPPSEDGSSKGFLRFEQRRQLLWQHIRSILDPSLMLAKFLLDKGSIAWDLMDGLLQDSLAVLESIGNEVTSSETTLGSSYPVKVSHIYYQYHSGLRKKDGGTKDPTCLRALRRSIDSVKSLSDAERNKAQILTKQERLAEFCNAIGRRDEAVDALRSIRDALVRDGALSDVTKTLSTSPVHSAWTSTEKAITLSRIVCSLAKVEEQPDDWTWLADGPGKATILEHDLHFIYAKVSKHHGLLSPKESVVEKLFQAYHPDDYPIRRLRALLHLAAIRMESCEIANWMDEARSLCQYLESPSSVAEDCGLVHYIPHLKALTACIGGLRDEPLDPQSVHNALAFWKSVAQTCQSASDLSKRVDNPSQLLKCLQSLADFMRLKGKGRLRGDVLKVSADLSRFIDSESPDVHITQNIVLCLQHLTMGQSSKAEKLLESNQEYISQYQLPGHVLAAFHLCAAEYHIAVGIFNTAEQHLNDAQAAASQTDKSSLLTRTTRKMTIAQASFLTSIAAMERGNSDCALHHAKNAVRLLFHDWQAMENARGLTEKQNNDHSKIDVSGDEMSVCDSKSTLLDVSRASTGPTFWALVYPLFRFVMQLSLTYSHVGVYQETLYYADQAQKIAESTGSIAYISQAKAWLAAINSTAGKRDEALRFAGDVRDSLSALEPSPATVEIACQVGRIFQTFGSLDANAELMDMANSMILNLGRSEESATWMEAELEVKMGELTIAEKAAPKSRAKKAIPKRTRTTTKSTAKKSEPKKPAVSVDVETLNLQDVQLSALRSSLSQWRSESLLAKKDWVAALAALHGAMGLSKLSINIMREQLYLAVASIGQGMDLMGHDSVFSVIQDSTLSFPALLGSKDKDRATTDRTPISKASPRKPRSTSPHDVPAFLEKLRQALGHLWEAQSLAKVNGNSHLAHRIATLLQNVLILLSTTNSGRSSGVIHPAHATCSVELARNLTWRRERKLVHKDSDKVSKIDWPVPTEGPSTRRDTMGFSMDMGVFQQEFVDIIPESWSVVSVSLSDNRQELCITKLEAGYSPFAIRLPLDRASSRDADTDIFNYVQGEAEMMDIIEKANRSCHVAGDMSTKEAKNSWWAERESLDNRLKTLVENIEQTWFGGFRGIFSQHSRRPDLLSRFQKSFQNILGKHLPSRRQVRGKRIKSTATTKVDLDPRILDLFVGLGEPTKHEDDDIDDQLLDLLYFVVDILQFHGEHNAYDEVDFDAMVVETFDALCGYHEAAKQSAEKDNDIHTLLVLDKPLHIFPWESLPSMQELSISRIPSLACLKRAILESRAANRSASKDVPDDNAEDTAVPPVREGHHISYSSGTSILNPSSDLKNTQNTFTKPLSTLPGTWSSIAERPPTEVEFENALESRDLLLYFGHGSGSQYIRGRVIRRLPKCRAVALLMGCSSASLPNPGEFEPNGPVWNYMLAGCPAVVGTLWDVTDRDIDRYAGRLIEEWGLLPGGTFPDDGKGGKPKDKSRGNKGKDTPLFKKRRVEEDISGKASLVQAVCRARDVCRFRYLTAAAVCIYGIPVYIEK